MISGQMAMHVSVPPGGVDPEFLLDGILDSFPEGSLFVFDRDLRYLAVGGESLPVMDVTPENLVGRTLWEAFPAEIAAAMEPPYRAVLAGTPAVADRVWGDQVFEARLAPIVRDGVVVAGFGYTVDVTDLRRAQAALCESEERLAHVALHDNLTGLPNRALVRTRLQEALAEVPEPGGVAVLFMDLDGFKRINDSYGHAAGDHVLTVVAQRLEDTVPATHTLGRMGGDEFVVVLGDDADVSWPALALAERLETVLAEPIAYEDAEFSVTVSIGIAVATAGDDADTVLRDSDTAMFRAKQNGKNRHVLFQGNYHDDAVGRARTEALLRRALADDELEVHYQPVVCSVTGSIVSVEALTRVPTGEGGYIDAAHLVAVAEQIGLVGLLGERVLEVACAQVASWRQRPGLDDLRLAVNVSASEIARPALYDRVMAALARTGLPASALILELTETVLIDAADSALSDLQRLRDSGIGIAIDDFGTGYASLRYVAELPVTCVKVDRSFTMDMLTNTTSASLVRATIRLAEDLGMRCIVEGVETLAHQDVLPRGSHIGYQGYLFARPAPAEELFSVN